MLVTIRILRGVLPRRPEERKKLVGYVRRAFDMKMEAIRADVDGQRLAQGTMNGGTAIISAGFHSSPTCSENHLTVRFFASSGEYAAVAHVFEHAEPAYFLAAKDRTSLRWKNTKFQDYMSRLDPWVGRWRANTK